MPVPQTASTRPSELNWPPPSDVTELVDVQEHRVVRLPDVAPNARAEHKRTEHNKRAEPQGDPAQQRLWALLAIALLIVSGILAARAMWPRRASASAASVGRAAASVSVPATPPSKGVGRLVISGPTGAQVWIDGVLRGTAPLTAADVAPGRHNVRVKTATGQAVDDVVVSSGETVAVVTPVFTPTVAAPRDRAVATPLPQPPAAAGSIAVSLPFQVQIYENGKFVGTNDGDPIGVAPGPHRLELVNESLQYRSLETVRVSPGKATALSPAVPTARVSLNAVPWGEVVVDGRSIGETPLAGVPLTIGPHEIRVRHPELGEQRRTVVVKAGAENRISVDFRK